MDPWAHFAWSLAGLAVWLLALGGFIDHWRTRHPMPPAAMAACLTVSLGSALTLTVSSLRFVDPSLDLGWAGHFQRGMLLATGIVALAHLIRSRRRW